MPRRPKPTALKLLEGNPGQRPLNLREPRPSRRPPACPMWLEVEAKREWRRIAPELSRMGLLSVIDRAALAMYCQNWARWVEADRDGSTSKIKLHAALCKSFLIEFGLTPASRSKLHAEMPAAPADPMAALLD